MAAYADVVPFQIVLYFCSLSLIIAIFFILDQGSSTSSSNEVEMLAFGGINIV